MTKQIKFLFEQKNYSVEILQRIKTILINFRQIIEQRSDLIKNTNNPMSDIIEIRTILSKYKLLKSFLYENFLDCDLSTKKDCEIFFKKILEEIEIALKKIEDEISFNGEGKYLKAA